MMEKSTISTESPVKDESYIYVYYNPKQTIRVSLKFPREEVSNMSLSKLISKSMKALSEDYFLDISQHKVFYSLFPATKTGCKRDGYPELDTKLSLEKVKIRRFFLEEMNPSSSLISTEFNLERKYGFEKKIKGSGMCCSIFNLRV